MAYAHVETVESSVNSAAGSRATGNFLSNPASGNTIVAWGLYVANSSQAPTFSDTLGNTYTSVTHFFDGAATFTGISVAVAKNITGGSANSVTMTMPGGTPPAGMDRIAVAASNYSGLSTTAPYTASDFAAATQSAPTTGTNLVSSGNTPTLSSGLGALLGFSVIYSSTSFPSAGSAFTSRATGWASAFMGFRLEDKAIAATTAVPALFTAAVNTNHLTIALYLQEQAAKALPPQSSFRPVYFLM